MSPPEPQNGASFQPAQIQRWNILAGFAEAVSGAAGRREVRGWCLLALLSLALAGVFALLLAVSRVPHVQDVFPWPLQFFEKGLVIHVVFSFVVWFLSVLGIMTAVATYRISAGRPRLEGLGMVALADGALAFILLFVPGFLDRGEASLNNYIPVIIDPLYYAGLAVFAVSLFLSLLRLFANIPGHEGPLEPVSVSTILGGAIFLVALVCFGLSGAALGDRPVDGAFNEDLFWVGGHALQFLNTSLMLVAWYLLGGIALATPLADPRLFRGAVIFLALLTVAFPVSYGIFEPLEFEQREAARWMQYGMAPSVLFLAGASIITLSNHRRRFGAMPWRDDAFAALAASAIVFFIGGFLGLFVDGADTRTPAHYHGVIGGVNLAFMGLFLVFFLPLTGRGRRDTKSTLSSILCYAIGQTLHSLGLFLAGGYGAPRKTAGDAQGIEALGAQFGLYMMGIGAVVAVVGGVMFIWIIGARLLRKP